MNGIERLNLLMGSRTTHTAMPGPESLIYVDCKCDSALACFAVRATYRNRVGTQKRRWNLMVFEILGEYGVTFGRRK
jgi:hypothetical protein